jgi:hypothetical protein
MRIPPENCRALLAASLFARRRAIPWGWLTAPEASRKFFCAYHWFFAQAGWPLDELG